MSDIVLTNTLTGKLERFEPLKAGEAGLYVCGLTPYGPTHLGHARCYVFFDIVRRTLEAAGLKVTHIQNFTDVDDRIIDLSAKEGVTPAVFAGR
ncbi:MAG: cysteine--tRNA ligase, partial [Elusimicrobiota bacterium]